MTAEQYWKRLGRIDQQLTMHSILRDRYRRRSRALSLLILFGSVVGLTVAAASGQDKVSLLGISATLQVWVAALSALTFLLALTELVTDWRQAAWQHGDAASRLATLKATFARAVVDDAKGATLKGVDLVAEYDSTMAALPVEIPDKRFNRLKAQHLRKVEVSRALSAAPGTSELLARFRVWSGRPVRKTPQPPSASPPSSLTGGK